MAKVKQLANAKVEGWKQYQARLKASYRKQLRLARGTIVDHVYDAIRVLTTAGWFSSGRLIFSDSRQDTFDNRNAIRRRDRRIIHLEAAYRSLLQSRFLVRNWERTSALEYDPEHFTLLTPGYRNQEIHRRHTDAQLESLFEPILGSNSCSCPLRFFAVRGGPGTGIYPSFENAFSKTLYHDNRGDLLPREGVTVRRFSNMEDAEHFLSKTKWYYAVRGGPGAGIFPSMESAFKKTLYRDAWGDRHPRRNVVVRRFDTLQAAELYVQTGEVQDCWAQIEGDDYSDGSSSSDGWGPRVRDPGRDDYADTMGDGQVTEDEFEIPFPSGADGHGDEDSFDELFSEHMSDPDLDPWT